MTTASPPLPSAPTLRSIVVRVRRVAREIVIVAVMLGVYEGARVFGGHNATLALRHASDMVRLESWLRMPRETDLQNVVLRLPDLVRFMNGYYEYVHLPLTALTLLWLMLRKPKAYPRIRTALFAATGVGLAVYLLLPVAPPRMLAGFVDTGALYGQSVYGKPGQHSLADQYAAMPSLHVGWAVIVAFALISTSRTRWRWLWVLHPIATFLIVVSTGNHYWLDGFAGAFLALTALWVTGRVYRHRAPVDAEPGSSRVYLTDAADQGAFDLRGDGLVHHGLQVDARELVEHKKR